MLLQVKTTKIIIGPSGLGKTNLLLDLIQKQDNDSLVDKIYLYAKDLINQRYFLFQIVSD